MDITKKPYEISLWKDQLVWHRRKLEEISKNSPDFEYERGKYYVKSKAMGADTYELDVREESEGPYYQLTPLSIDNCIERYSSKDIQISPEDNSDWYSFALVATDERDLEGPTIYYLQENNKWRKVDKKSQTDLKEDWYEAIPVPQIVVSFYKENRLCTIGSNTMDSLARCVNPKLVRKVNGENTLTFTMYYQYVDNQTGELQYNPFVKLISNERKIKLRVGEPGEGAKWYDFIVKQRQENSESKAFTYTCKDQFINELSKSGFDIELDNELENNMGTAKDLAKTVLADSDWRLKTVESLEQFVEEPLYKIGIDKDSAPNAEDMKTKASIAWASFNDKPLQYIYVFYSHINNQEPRLQFLYTTDDSFETDDDLVIDKTQYPNYILTNDCDFIEDEVTHQYWPEFAVKIEGTTQASFESSYRGMRLVRQIQTKYDSTIDKFVQVYTKGNETYYGFTQSKYISPNTVNNYIVNPNAFTSITGWYTEKSENGAKPILELKMEPDVIGGASFDSEANFTSFLYFPNNGSALMNSSINGFKSTIEELTEGTQYILRIKYKTSLPGEYSTKAPNATIGKYKIEDDIFDIEKDYFEFSEWTEKKPTNETEKSEGYIYLIADCKESLSKTDLKKWDNRYGLFLNFEDPEIYIEEVQLFPYITVGAEGEEKLCVPGGEIVPEVKTIYNYYKPNSAYSSVEDVVFSDQSEEPVEGYTIQYNDGADAYTKVRSITAKESNRFNLLQDINEAFECWARFEVERDKETGEILLGKDLPENPFLTGDEAYRQQKFVSFYEYAGTKNHIGFKYGINSKSIQRTVDSNAIVSKMIVKDNANEFAPNGFCSIARATENPIKENFILNFDHYIRQNLLDIGMVTNDLYVDVNGHLGYYKKLKNINIDKDALIDKQTNLANDIIKYTAAHQTYKTSYDAAVQERLELEDSIVRLITPPEAQIDGRSFEDIVKQYSANWIERDEYIKYMAQWAQCKNVEDQHKPLYEKAERGLKESQDKYDEITNQLKEKAEQKRALNLQFYKKYSRFIQEGSWIKEDYVDDNLYYLDSLGVLHTSSQPKVTYNISVIDISQALGLDGTQEYKDYKFEIGDITYIEDPEFFGWSLKNGKTPYREEIVVSEITEELDSPEKDSIKVQNYKTQFEDLFQRITATTQQAEYHTGEYNRAAAIVEKDGTISVSTLESSFSNNQLRLQNAKDQSVVIDEYGITSTSLSNPSEMVRIVSGGIFMSTDGGLNWKTGLTGHGLNSSYLTAGQINTDEIYVMNGSHPAFRWDKDGLSAYDYSRGFYNLNQYVRFDHMGIYGKFGEGQFNSVDDVMSQAPFALTWRGFSLKNNDGSVKITSDEDIQVLSKEDGQGEVSRIKIGRIDKKEDDTYVYGIQISDATGAPVMLTKDDGTLWLENKLSVETSQGNPVAFGRLDINEDDLDEDHGSRVIAAGSNNDFVVYEDGHIKATSGEIGSMTIESIEDSTIRVEITSSRGNSMKEGTQTVLTAYLYQGGVEITEGPTTSLTYQWQENGVDIEGATGKEHLIEKGVNFGGKGFAQYTCKITKE